MTDGDGSDTGRTIGPKSQLGRMALRLCVIIAIAVAASQLISASMTLTERLPEAGQAPMQIAVIVLALVIYALLIATPFVPGIEIGFALLVMRGVSIAPAVYLATVIGLLLAYFIGRLVPEPSLEQLFRDLRLRRAAQLISAQNAMTLQERQEALRARLPKWLVLPATRYRYLVLACLINLPGNALLGGGGGLMLAAGLSRLFTPRATVLTTALAVLPLPLGFWLFGGTIFAQNI